MAKVTSKLQLTLPKAVADDHGIQPGDELHVFSAGQAIRLVPARANRAPDIEARLRLFDQATRRQRRRRRDFAGRTADPGWTREGLYERGRSR